jgi:hypothetical protein
MNKKLTFATKTSLIACIALVAIQVIPYGKNHTNPAVIREPSWDSMETRALAKRACFDCHSNETVWKWYSRFAPVSWLVQYDVNKGREELNLSDWQNGAREGERSSKIGAAIAEGEMPPLPYLLAHPEARLTKLEKKRLADGLTKTADKR